ncbi:MAG: retroviral-like aspartic protease family protein [Thermoplasmata archaeon]
MGVFKVRVKVFNLQHAETGQEVEMVVDTGATYPVIPRTLAEELGIQVTERRTFTLADGTQVARDLGWAGISYDGRSSPCLVVLGEEGDVPLLGSFALEGLGLEVDPVARSLRPAPQFLL